MIINLQFSLLQAGKGDICLLLKRYIKLHSIKIILCENLSHVILMILNSVTVFESDVASYSRKCLDCVTWCVLHVLIWVTSINIRSFITACTWTLEVNWHSCTCYVPGLSKIWWRLAFAHEKNMHMNRTGTILDQFHECLKTQRGTHEHWRPPKCGCQKLLVYAWKSEEII